MVNNKPIQLAATSFFKFAGVGFLMTVCSAFAYWVLATLFGLDPNFALLVVFSIFTLVGHWLHGIISFRDQTGGNLSRSTGIRFAVVNLIGFSLNQGAVMILVKILGYENWVPIIPMVLVTPIVVFFLSRFWVFYDDTIA